MSLCPTHGATHNSADRCPLCKIEAALKVHADLIQQLMGQAKKPQAKADEPAKTRKRAG